MAANWARVEVPCGVHITICERGQCIRSQEQWAEIFGKNWNRSKVQRFFKLLQNASMIRTENAHKAIKLTVVNYNAYQDVRSDNAHKMSTKRAQDEHKMSTDNNTNNNNHYKQRTQDDQDMFASSEIKSSERKWQMEKFEDWAKALRSYNCKIGPDNWLAWDKLVSDHTLKAVLEASSATQADKRWPDNVEKALGPQLGSSAGLARRADGSILL